MKEYWDSLALSELLHKHKEYAKSARKTAARIHKLQNVAYASARRAASTFSQLERRYNTTCALLGLDNALPLTEALEYVELEDIFTQDGVVPVTPMEETPDEQD